MTRAHIAEKISDCTGLSNKRSAECVECVYETLKQTLARGEDVKIAGFGKFFVRQKNSRRGRNPKTGEEVVIEARRVLIFKASTIFRQQINGSGTGR